MKTVLIIYALAVLAHIAFAFINNTSISFALIGFICVLAMLSVVYYKLEVRRKAELIKFLSSIKEV